MSKRTLSDPREAALVRKGRIVIRLDEMGIDEVVAFGVDVHLERMDSNDFCLIVYAKGEIGCYRIAAKKATVTAFESWRERKVGGRATHD